jgi:cellulose biosynthesis protein BcsQ
MDNTKSADYLIIPSDLKPFANQGLINVKDFIKRINGYRKVLRKLPLEILGVLACKISTNGRFVQYTLPKRIEATLTTVLSCCTAVY